MENRHFRVFVILSLLGALLSLTCSVLYFVSQWRKQQITKVDIVVTAGITFCSLCVFIISVVCCYQGWHRTPSPKEIKRNSTYVPITKVMGSNCGICLESKDFTKIKVVELTCGHSFHKDCVIQSLETQPKCPICRQTPYKFSTAERLLYQMYGKVSKAIIEHKHHTPNEDEESAV